MYNIYFIIWEFGLRAGWSRNSLEKLYSYRRENGQKFRAKH